MASFSSYTHTTQHHTHQRMMSQAKRRGDRLLSVVVVLLLTIGGSTSKTVVEASIAQLVSKPKPFVSKSTSVSTLSSTLSTERDATSDRSDTIDTVVTINETVVPRCGGNDEVTPLAHRLKVGGYFAVWYILNIIYNSKCSPPKTTASSVDFFNVFVHYMQTNTEICLSTLFDLST